MAEGAADFAPTNQNIFFLGARMPEKVPDSAIKFYEDRFVNLWRFADEQLARAGDEPTGRKGGADLRGSAGTRGETARLMVEAGATVAIGDLLDERGRETARTLGAAPTTSRRRVAKSSSVCRSAAWAHPTISPRASRSSPLTTRPS
jgi:hypothetical protein